MSAITVSTASRRGASSLCQSRSMRWVSLSKPVIGCNALSVKVRNDS